MLSATDNTRPAACYFVRTIRGKLEKVKDRVCVIISRRRKGDKLPKFFACSDLSLTAQATLRLYLQRCLIEVDNLYLKNSLGVGDFRLQSYEATHKWFAVVLLDLNFLQLQQAQHYHFRKPSSLPHFVLLTFPVLRVKFLSFFCLFFTPIRIGESTVGIT